MLGSKSRELATSVEQEAVALSNFLDKGKSSITLRRSGSFKMEQLGRWHCGAKGEDPSGCGVSRNGIVEVKYNLAVECGIVLDDRGFLFDNGAAQAFFNGIVKSALSCELLTMTCAMGIVDVLRIENRDIDIKSILLTLSPSEQTSCTFGWQPRLL